MKEKYNGEVAFFTGNAAKKQAENEIMQCNEITEKFGLRLTQKQASELITVRELVLSANGRIEFGGGAVDKLIREFCDSPFISMHNYEEVLHDLVEIFYSYKNETLDQISDEELIQFMKHAFDGVCHGSVELLSERELAKMARALRDGHSYQEFENDLGEAEMEEEIDEY